MVANIDAVRTNVDALSSAETDLSKNLYDLSFTAEYGHGSTSQAIDALRQSRKHADRAVIAAGLGNAIMAAKHEAQAAAADGDADRMLHRAKAHADDLVDGLEAAAAGVRDATGHATSLISVDDSSPAAALPARIAAQSEAVENWARRAEEIRARIPGSRDPGELQVAADHFGALRHELEEGSGRAQEIASDALGYSSAI